MKRLVLKNKRNLRSIRQARVRKAVVGTAKSPRLSVFRSLKGIVTQLVDDGAGKTLCAATSREIKKTEVEGKAHKVAAAFLTGKLLAEKAKAKGIAKVVFDRAGYKYHGRVQAVADGARAGGLEF